MVCAVNTAWRNQHRSKLHLTSPPALLQSPLWLRMLRLMTFTLVAILFRKIRWCCSTCTRRTMTCGTGTSQRSSGTANQVFLLLCFFCLFWGWGVLFYILTTSKVMGTNIWQCALVATLQCCPTGRPCHQHHDLIFHSVTEPSNPCPILMMLSAWLGSDKRILNNPMEDSLL